MWCPKCKTEYREGIKVCADCGTELVEQSQIEEVDICEINDETTATELLEFLNYSGLKEARMELSEDGKCYQIIVPKELETSADKVVHGYLLAKEEEKEEQVVSNATTEEASETLDSSDSDKLDTLDAADYAGQSEDTPNEPLEAETEDNLLMTDDVDEDTIDLLYTSAKKEYVKKADLYRDTKFSGITFLIFGILGGIYLTLSKTKVIPIQYNIVVFVIIAALFAGFIIAGIVSMVKSRKIKLEIPKEEEQTKLVKEWLEENITDEIVEGWQDNSISEMENDLMITAHIRRELLKAYPELQKEYIEMIADEYFEERFLKDE